MENIRYWPEMVISGSFYLFGFIFFGMGLLGLNSFEFLHDAVDFLLILSALFLGAAYFLGFVAHRVIPVLVIKPIKDVLKLIYNIGSPYQKKLIDKSWGKLLSINDYEKISTRIKVYQFASKRLMQELDQQFSWVALLTSSSIGLPVLAMGLSFWINHSPNTTLALPVAYIAFSLEIFLIIALYKQLENFHNLQRDTYTKFLRLKIKHPDK